MDVVSESILPNIVLEIQPYMTSLLRSFGDGGALTMYLADAV